ncbi:hypothetical protein XAR_2317 [Xanthomonas citri pv. glycines str. 8ra]|nr:hypothetical protein XAR_2317 [Xanthomonas citri pv. glycines str. 8ra]
MIVTVCAAAWPATSTAIAQVRARNIDKGFFMGFSGKGWRRHRGTDGPPTIDCGDGSSISVASHCWFRDAGHARSALELCMNHAALCTAA